MVKASTNSAIDLSGVADRVNSAAEARRRAIINDPDEAVYVVARGQKRARHPEIYRMDTVAVMAEKASRRNSSAYKPAKAQDDDYDILRSFCGGIAFAMLLLLVAELIVSIVG